MNSSSKKILVTGASGFVGSHLCQKLLSSGHELIALNRSGSLIDGARQTLSWRFGELIPNKLMECDVAIHLAHDFRGKIGAELTISGTKKLVSHLYARGTKRQLFVTSYSAGKHASSRYGKTKNILEKFFRRDNRNIIVRPGLIIGNGGIYNKIATFICNSPLIPLLDGGRGYVTFIKIERLCDEIVRLCFESDPPQIANLFELQGITLRKLVKNIASKAKRRPLLVSIPAPLALLIIRILDSLKIPLPANYDSLVGFLDNQSAQHVSTLKNKNETA